MVIPASQPESVPPRALYILAATFGYSTSMGPCIDTIFLGPSSSVALMCPDSTKIDRRHWKHWIGYVSGLVGGISLPFLGLLKSLINLRINSCQCVVTVLYVQLQAQIGTQL